jgi:predicted transcriptional regulator
MAETVRIEPSAHAALSEIAKAMHIPLTEALSRAIEHFRREAFLTGLAADFAALKPVERAEERAERDAWASTDADGLRDEE